MLKYLILCCALWLPQQSIASNNHFYKGDAYFSTLWKTGDFKKNNTALELAYNPLTLSLMDCGNGGVSNFFILNIPDTQHQNLLKVDAILKKQSKKYTQLLVYNKDYDFKKWGIAFRYNEDWMKLQSKYDLLGDSSRIVQDWREAKNVIGLKSNTLDYSKITQEQLGELYPDSEESADEPTDPEDPFEGKSFSKIIMKGQSKDYAFAFILSNTIDRMMENSAAEAKSKRAYYKKETIAKNELLFLETLKKPIEPLKFIVVTDKIRLFEELKAGKWKVTEIK